MTTTNGIFEAIARQEIAAQCHTLNMDARVRRMINEAIDQRVQRIIEERFGTALDAAAELTAQWEPNRSE